MDEAGGGLGIAVALRGVQGDRLFSDESDPLSGDCLGLERRLGFGEGQLVLLEDPTS